MNQIILAYKNVIRKMYVQMRTNVYQFNQMLRSKESEISNLKLQIEELKQQNALLQTNLGELQNMGDNFDDLPMVDSLINASNKEIAPLVNKIIRRTIIFSENGEQTETYEIL